MVERICTNCKFYQHSDQGRKYARCMRPSQDQGFYRLDLVDGKPTDLAVKFCGIERAIVGDGWCGPAGKFSEVNLDALRQP